MAPWAAKVIASPISRSVNGLTWRRHKRDHCHDLVVTLDRYSDDGPEPPEPLPKPLLLRVVLRIVGDVRRHHRLPLKCHPADERAGGKRDLTLRDQRSVFVRAARRAGEPEVVVLVDEDLPRIGTTQPDRMLEDRLEDGLELEVRTTDR